MARKASTGDSSRKTVTQRTSATPKRRATRTASGIAASAGRSPAASACTEDRIRERAYYIHLQRQGAPGDPIADWLQAERELKATATSSGR